jgi:hypothetical protein
MGGKVREKGGGGNSGGRIAFVIFDGESYDDESVSP